MMASNLCLPLSFSEIILGKVVLELLVIEPESFVLV